MVVVVETAATVEPRLSRADVREDFYRASGKGGQNRNKVETAVRLTHLPTGIVAQASEERTQGKNRSVAWARLEKKLAKTYGEKISAEQAEAKAEQFDLTDAWTWTDYSDDVKSPRGARMSMKRALRGDLKRVLS